MKTYALTREQVRELCPSCADSMAMKGLAALKLFVEEDGEVRFGDGSEVKLYAGFSQGLCDKFGADEGFFTRCAETMSGKVEDSKAFCASLHKFCVGKWPAEKKMAKRIVELAHSNAINGVEIFSPGKHNGDDYTEADIDEMIAAFKDLDFRPALKVGHTKDKPGAPSYGWVANLRKAGGKLVADLTDMHDSVIQAIKDRRYDRISSEIYFNLKRGGKTFRRALKAVALLGAEVPAVAGLTPLHKMEFAESGFESIAICAADLNVDKQALVDSLTARVSGLEQLFNEQKEQDAMTIKELREKKAALEAELATLKAKGDGADKAKVAELEAKVKEFGQQIDSEIERLTAAAGESDSLKETVRALQAKDRAREVTEKVARCTVKSFHGRLEGLYAHAVANPAVKIKQFAEKDGKRTESENSLVEALDGLVAQINAGAQRLFVVDTRNEHQRMAEDAEIEDAGQKVDELAKARVREGKSKTYEEAMDAVLAADKDLAHAYNEQQNAASRANRA